jgi:hypothetical protein
MFGKVRLGILAWVRRSLVLVFFARHRVDWVD